MDSHRDAGYSRRRFLGRVGASAGALTLGGVAGGTAGFQILRRTYADGRLVEVRYSRLPSASAHFRVSLANLDARREATS